MKVKVCDFSTNLMTKEQADNFIQEYLAFTLDEEWWEVEDILILVLNNVKRISDDFIQALFLPMIGRFSDKETFYKKVSVSGGQKIFIEKINNFISSFYQREMQEKISSVIDNIKPCHFRYIGDNKITFGVIAQDLLEIFPEDKFSIVTKQNNGFYAVNYNQLIPFLIKEIQVLKERIKNLEES